MIHDEEKKKKEENKNIKMGMYSVSGCIVYLISSHRAD
jgi:hypothetical protein